MNILALNAVAASIRSLSMDAIQKANSGHPGLPLGCAEFGALLFGEVLKHCPFDPKWMDRDRFVLSAGHGSMLLYSLLYLSGYGLTKDDIVNFRQIGARTPGHPEYGHTKGVETTTGPLGAGFSNAVGMAIAEQMLASRFNTDKREIIDHYTYVLAGDGCMMEGVTSEAASLAGHLGLGKLIVFYDSNNITIEGSTDLAFSEDVLKRFEAFNWQTLSGDAYNYEELFKLVNTAREEKEKPTIIKMKSVIGRGSPNMAGSNKVHGAPLGEEEVIAAKKKLGIPENEFFYVDPDSLKYFEEKNKDWNNINLKWQKEFYYWAKENPLKKREWDRMLSGGINYRKSVTFPEYKSGENIATRTASGKTLEALSSALPNIVGGSADLSPSNNTAMPSYGDFSRDDRSGHTLHFGVREHAMGGVINGITLHEGLRAFGATFLVFADYMRPAIRLACLMKIPVIYVFTHDSIYIGEDGPTHQPVEQIASLRIIPDMLVLRPGDAQETVAAWEIAMEKTDGPIALILTRQKLEVYSKDDSDWQGTIKKGAYIVKDSSEPPEIVIVATGSEVALAIKAAETINDKNIRIVSMISRELFLAQNEDFRKSIIPERSRTITVEAGVSYGWERFASSSKDILSIDSFGKSGPGKEVADSLGFNIDALRKIILE